MQADDSDYNSDGSDYFPDREDAALEDNDDEIGRMNDTCLVRVGTKGVTIHDVPIPKDFCADPYQISVAQLEEQIRYNIRKGTVKDALTKVDITSKVFSNPQYLPREIQLGKDRFPPRETRYQVIQKTYGSCLHYACHDPNGSRGEHKIRFLLWVAGRYKIPVSKLLTLSEVTVRKYGNEWHKVTVDAGMERMQETTATPLYILLDDPNSSVNAVRLLAEAWPSIVHLPYFTSAHIFERHNTLSHFLMKNPVSPNHPENDVARVLAIVKALLQAASKTKLGAKSLLVTQLGTSESSENDLHTTVVSRNAIHIALSHGTCIPPEMLTMMLSVWPEAVQQSGHGYKSDESCPLHVILNQNPKTAKACFWQAKCIEAILQYSTLESVAMGLVRTRVDGRLQFQNIMKRISELAAMKETVMVEGLVGALKALVRKRDAQGKTILHHVVVAPVFRSSLALEATPHRKRRKCLSTRRVNCHVDLVRWALQQEPSLARVCDKEGQNALHTALKYGSTWNAGVREMVEMVPDWQYEPTELNGEGDLLPFQIAATAYHGDLDTIYELLKITGPLAFSHLL